MRPEPHHPNDEHAIAVFSERDIQLGYIPSVRAVLIGKIMREGREVRAIYQGWGETAPWCRVAFDGADPVLPIQPEAEAEPDFYPDPEWPDE